MKHTPGPWTVASYDTADGDEGGTVLHRITAHAAGAAVADQVFTESDARLIAAAPDLLAALQRAENLIDNYEATISMRGGHAAEILAQARAALSKALGE